MKIGNVCVSFDDGRIDTYTKAYKIMKKYGLRGTIHIVTGYVDKTYLATDFNNIPPLTKFNLKELNDYGMEIASHGDKHITETKDFLISYQKINMWLDEEYDKMGFSIPKSKCDETILKQMLNNEKILYVRGGRDSKSFSFIGKSAYIMYKFTRFQLFYNLFNKHNINYDNNVYLKSIVIKKGDKAKSVLNFIKKYSKPNTAIVLMLHSIGETKAKSDNWIWEEKQFEKLCLELSILAEKGMICVKPIRTLF